MHIRAARGSGLLCLPLSPDHTGWLTPRGHAVRENDSHVKEKDKLTLRDVEGPHQRGGWITASPRG